MCRKLVVLLALAAGPATMLATLAPSAVCRPPALPGPGAIVSMHVQLFRAIDAGDATRAASFVGPRAETSLFLSQNGDPTVSRGRDEVARQLAEWARASADGTHASRGGTGSCPRGSRRRWSRASRTARSE